MNYNKFESYSSYGEDAVVNGVLRRLSWILDENMFEAKTYLDIGSFHPVKDSNTYFLYKDHGWSGTLVDPNNYFNILVHELRPRDIIYNCAIDVTPGDKEFFMFGSIDSSNTLSKEFADRKVNSQHTDVSWTVTVPSKTLNEIIDIHVDYFKQLPFFMNIDIEGLDHDVMATYSYPDKIPFIMIEDDSGKMFERSPVKKLMKSMGYSPIATTCLSTLYVDLEGKYKDKLSKIGMFE